MWEWLQSADPADYIRASIEILLLAILFYSLYKAFRKTQAVHIVHAVAFLAIPSLLLIFLLNLGVISYLMTRILGPGLVAGLIIIFQPELRRSLEKLGRSPLSNPRLSWLRALFSLPSQESDDDEFIDAFCKSVIQLSNKQMGALFAFERNTSLDDVIKTGVVLNAQFSPELVLAIFHFKAALHDGGVIISQERIEAAACIFPVTSKEVDDHTLGLRHRAGLGLSEDSDCVVVIVSEETGHISIAHGGRLERNIDKDQFQEQLSNLLQPEFSDV